MNSHNVVCLRGVLASDPEFKSYESKKDGSRKEFCTFSVATQKQIGKDKFMTEEFPCTAFGRSVGFLKGAKGGCSVVVVGSLSCREYKGTKSYSVMVETLAATRPPESPESPEPQQQRAAPAPSKSEPPPTEAGDQWGGLFE